MDEHFEEDCPELLKLLRERCKTWDFMNRDSIDENIERLLEKSSWGLLRDVEAELVKLSSYQSIERNRVQSCPYNPEYGCSDGKIARILMNSVGTQVSQTSILCRAWDRERQCCVRIDGRSP